MKGSKGPFAGPKRSTGGPSGAGGRTDRPGFGIRSEPAPPDDPRQPHFERSSPERPFSPTSRRPGGRSSGPAPFRGGGGSGSGPGGGSGGRPRPDSWPDRGGFSGGRDDRQGHNRGPQPSDPQRGYDRPPSGQDRRRGFDARPGGQARPFGPPPGRPDRGRPHDDHRFNDQKPDNRADRPPRSFDRPGPAFDAPDERFDQSSRPFDHGQRTEQWARPEANRPDRRPDFRGGDRPDRRPPSPPWAAGGEQRRPWSAQDRRPPEEAFVARRPAIRLLVVPQRRPALERLVLHATSLRIPIVEIEGGTLTAVAGFDGHQGIALVVGPRRFASLDEILARGIERGEPSFVLALDSLEDPQNVGTLLRSAEAAGVHGVIFPTHRQAPLSPSAIKASAGAVEHLLLSPVDDLPGALSDLRIRGLRVVGAEAGAPLTARQSDLRGPLAIVVGSEGQGLSPGIRRRCDFVVRIPMRGAIGSLNAAVAGSILLFEAVAQRDPDGRGAANAPARTELDTDDGAETTESEERAETAEATDAATGATATTEPAASDAGEFVPVVEPDEVAPPEGTSDVAGDEAEPASGDLLPGGPDPGS
jgi:23S rRNA (guanosine2251-2'-O)-methyltransferase